MRIRNSFGIQELSWQINHFEVEKKSNDNMESLIASTPHVFIMDRKKIHGNVDRRHYLALDVTPHCWLRITALLWNWLTSTCIVIDFVQCSLCLHTRVDITEIVKLFHAKRETNHKLGKNFFAYYSILRAAQLRFMNCDDLPEVSSRIKEECVLWWFMK